MQSLVSLLLHYKYFVVLPLALFEGPFTMMTCGFLLKLGYLTIVPVFILLFIGDLFGDIMWYGIGYQFGKPFLKKFGRFFNITDKTVERVQKIFKRHDSKIIFISKITMGFGFALATLITAGITRIPAKRFIFWNALGEFIWIGTLLLIGFSMGKFYVNFGDTLGKLNSFALFVMIAIALIGIAKYSIKKIMQKNLL